MMSLSFFYGVQETTFTRKDVDGGIETYKNLFALQVQEVFKFLIFASIYNVVLITF